MTVRTVLLVGLPSMLEDIVRRALQSSPDLKVARAGAAGDPAAAASAANAEIVVVAHRDPAEIVAVAPVLANLSILALTPDGTSAYMHRIRCETSRIEDVSPDGIRRALAEAKPVR